MSKRERLFLELSDDSELKFQKEKKSSRRHSQQTSHHDQKHVRIILTDCCRSASHAQINEFLKNKFTSQQLGKKKWLINRELEYPEFIPIEFMNDPEFILNHVTKYGYGLSGASSELRFYKDFVLKVVQKNGMQLARLCIAMRGDKEIVLKAVTQHGWLLEHASYELREDKEVVLAAVSSSGVALLFASEELHTDRDVVLAAVKHNTIDLSDDLLNDKELLLQAAQLGCYRVLFGAPAEICADKDFVTRVVQRNGNALEYANESFRSDKQVVLNAVRNKGQALLYASDELRKYPEIVLEAVKSNGFVMGEYSHELYRARMEHCYFGAYVGKER